LIAEVIATGASFDELREAWAWLNGDEALMNEGRPLPGTRVAALIDLLESTRTSESSAWKVVPAGNLDARHGTNHFVSGRRSPPDCLLSKDN
jgi:hypothetical protein